MKGKHLRKNKKRKHEKVDKSKLKMVLTIILLIVLSITFMIVHGITNKQNNYNMGNNESINIVVSQQESVSTNEVKEETKVTSRGSVNRTKIKILDEPKTLYVSAKIGLNVRDSYNNGKIVKSIPYAEKVVVTAEYENWGKIGDDQWVSIDYLTETKPKVEKRVTTQNNSTKTTSKKETTSNSGYVAFTATAYCGCSKCCGKSTGITASGAKAKAGVTVAMSSKYPFGTKVEIKGMGTYIVQDRGGAINGNRIDIYFNSHSEALKFGRRTVYLKVL